MRCDRCNGTGWFTQSSPANGDPLCPDCGGYGQVSCCEGAENVKCYCAPEKIETPHDEWIAGYKKWKSGEPRSQLPEEQSSHLSAPQGRARLGWWPVMDSNTILASYYHPGIPQMVSCNGVQWGHEIGGDWVPICVYE